MNKDSSLPEMENNIPIHNTVPRCHFLPVLFKCFVKAVYC